MAKKNLSELINSKVSEQLKDVQTELKATAKSKTKKLVPIKEPKSKKTQVIKEVEEQQKPSIIEKVISHREVKYIYPADVQDTLARKKWRQQVRNKLHELELKMNRLREGNKKEFEEAKKAFESYKAQVLKPEQVA